jgi:hypothetical protein
MIQSFTETNVVVVIDSSLLIGSNSKYTTIGFFYVGYVKRS